MSHPGLRVEKTELANIYDGVRIVHESTAYDMMIEEGELRANHRSLLRLGRQRFGPADPETESAVKAITDLHRLERMIDAVLKANSWQEFVSTAGGISSRDHFHGNWATIRHILAA